MDVGEVKATWMGGPRHGRPETVVPGQPVYVDDSAERILGYVPGTRWIGGTVWVVKPQLWRRRGESFRFWVLRWESRRVV